MRVSAILFAGASVAVAQDITGLPSGITLPSGISIPGDVNSLLAAASTAIPNFSELVASAESFGSSLIGTQPIPTDPAGQSSYLASVENAVATAFGVSAADITGSPAAGQTGAPAAGGNNGSPMSTSTGGAVAPMQTGLGMMIAGGVAAGIAAVAL